MQHLQIKWKEKKKKLCALLTIANCFTKLVILHHQWCRGWKTNNQVTLTSKYNYFLTTPWNNIQRGSCSQKIIILTNNSLWKIVFDINTKRTSCPSKFIVCEIYIQSVHKVRVHFKKFITLLIFATEIICTKCYKV